MNKIFIVLRAAAVVLACCIPQLLDASQLASTGNEATLAYHGLPDFGLLPSQDDPLGLRDIAYEERKVSYVDDDVFSIGSQNYAMEQLSPYYQRNQAWEALDLLNKSDRKAASWILPAATTGGGALVGAAIGAVVECLSELGTERMSNGGITMCGAGIGLGIGAIASVIESAALQRKNEELKKRSCEAFNTHLQRELDCY
jgi:hypothetical protein